MYPGHFAQTTPDKPAAILADTGETLTYAELDARSNQLARLLRDNGLSTGDVVALLTDNDITAFEVYWAAVRSGLYITAVNRHLSVDEVSYIVNDSGAAAIVASAAVADVAEAIVPTTPHVRLRLAFGGDVPHHGNYRVALQGQPADPLPEQPRGMPMLYSSGTTGLPKGVRPPLPPVSVGELGDPIVALSQHMFGVTSDTVYLSPAPLYHAAPLRWSGAIQSHGGTVVLTRKFDAVQSLRLIGEMHVTHAQFVPTMFIRMLQLDDAQRAAFDLSSLRVAIHAAAPCPVQVKQRMIEWWGPILMEYYSGTEGNGITLVDSAAWLQRPGTVGKSVLGVIHICDDEGLEVPTGQVGNVYFERDLVPFVYHNDDAKTAAAQHPQHPLWTTMGDVGYVDEEGYLFLTDRKSFMIISGGVNIYPQEVENVLALHPHVQDVAVIGVPDEDMGEAVLAVVVPRGDAEAGPDLEREIIEFVKGRVAHYKAPRSVRFRDTLPRTETGKLLKAELKKTFASAPV
jgi:long-chain acyl-CoA synthetase